MNIKKYDVFGATDKGLVREINEDQFLIDLDCNLFAVADGLGGLPNGELASKLAINTLASIPSKAPINFKTAFNSINQIINTIGDTINSDFGIGTTLTAIQLYNDKLYCGHVGDSGLFLFTKNQWFKLTKDHTMAQDIRDNSGIPSDQLSIPDYYNQVLTQCLGKGNSLKIQTFERSLTPNDRLLLYSDGVTKALTPTELHLLAFESTTSEQFVTTILDKANSRGGIDNITAVAIFI